MTRLLIIEDNIALGKALKEILELSGYDVLLATDGPAGLCLADEWQPDLIILDVMLPYMTGWEVCQRLRKKGDTPIVMLTARTLPTDVVQGLKSGADDYVRKPFDMEELIWRIEAVLRRARRPAAASSERYRINNLLIDLSRRIVLRNGQPVQLTPTEFSLLAHLVRNQGRVVPYTELLIAVWGENYTYDERANLAVYIHYLRKKLEETPDDPKYICTERGVGYRLRGARNEETMALADHHYVETLT